MTALNETHDPKLISWVASANLPGNDFPVQNLPFAIFRRKGSDEIFRGGVAIGDQVLDLAALSSKNVLSSDAQQALLAASGSTLNDFMALGHTAWSSLRLALSRLLREDAKQQAITAQCLLDMEDVEYALPAHIGDYTDFYTSIHHATNVGKLFRPDNPLLPNYRWIPIGYHGRASSVVLSGHDVRRPQGQLMPPGAESPTLAPSKRLDFELELGIFVGAGNSLGTPIPMDQAEQHVFGICLLNDWSARDIQGWEYQPLGPFLSKSFATSISPWIVTLEALAPYRLPFTRDADEPQPLPYLDSEHNRAAGAFDIQLKITLATPAMREAKQPAHTICQTSYRHAYWTLAQLITHHTVNGCNLQAGDLLGSGTLSGPEPHQLAAMLEITQGGKIPLTLPNGEERIFLEDGDQVTLRGWCATKDAARIGFGECIGTVFSK
ncbi:MAG: fumarylacetoacetase [Burkholderiales bacterium]|nr:fumarylacetoacetase [Burkholderiales bacterium]